MKSIHINEAQRRLPELVDAVADEGDVVITREERPVARLTALTPEPSLRDIRPASVGAILRPFSAEDDLLEELLEQ